MANTTSFKVTEPAAATIPETDFEVRSLDAMCVNESQKKHPWWHNLKYSLVGIFFGITFVKAEIISWYRIQEMFRLESFHMYGVIGTAVAVGVLSVLLIKKWQIKTIYGEPITFSPKTFSKGQIFGGLLFGFGWAMTGACPGPLFAQVGTGATVILVTILSAIAGTWVYGYFRDKLPH
ncbi:MAG: YeeE/YedE family protein [Thermoanaerobaculia bacterium]|nr:YeeE/YedE family protein [Thermoanaerobaculia bacterium]